jgi:hypothetical protein
MGGMSDNMENPSEKLAGPVFSNNPVRRVQVECKQWVASWHSIRGKGAGTSIRFYGTG